MAYQDEVCKCPDQWKGSGQSYQGCCADWPGSEGGGLAAGGTRHFCRRHRSLRSSAARVRHGWRLLWCNETACPHGGSRGYPRQPRLQLADCLLRTGSRWRAGCPAARIDEGLEAAARCNLLQYCHRGLCHKGGGDTGSLLAAGDGSIAVDPRPELSHPCDQRIRASRSGGSESVVREDSRAPHPGCWYIHYHGVRFCKSGRCAQSSALASFYAECAR
mmetsp:Transcript_39916/g.87126  ORF Transcript_39916/g.87126 Transcript_39916/m.87126 type:complete len:218 (-) Transcript_39916:633-1286(-)